jgi:hypothetical protein
MLTKEQIEGLREVLMLMTLPYEQKAYNSLCDMALASLRVPEAHPAITAIKEHNMGCLEACGKYTSHQHVRDARRCDSRRDCPDCPTDWVIDLNGLVPDEQPQPQRVQSSKENNDG